MLITVHFAINAIQTEHFFNITEGYKPGQWGCGFLSDKSNNDRSALLCSFLKKQIGGQEETGQDEQDCKKWNKRVIPGTNQPENLCDQ